MHAEPKRLLIEALRSGEYPQTTGKLHDSVGYCCLGVLCEVAIENGVAVRVDECDPALEIHSYDGRIGILPDSVIEWSGMEDKYGTFHREDDISRRTDDLINLNDSGLSFDEIADTVEKYL